MAKFIQSKLDDLDMHNKAIAEEKLEDGEEEKETKMTKCNDESETKNSHFQLKARQKAVEVSDFELSKSADAAYKNFRKNLTRYFKHFFHSQHTDVNYADTELPNFTEINKDDEVSAFDCNCP